MTIFNKFLNLDTNKCFMGTDGTLKRETRQTVSTSVFTKVSQATSKQVIQQKPLTKTKITTSEKAWAGSKLALFRFFNPSCNMIDLSKLKPDKLQKFYSLRVEFLKFLKQQQEEDLKTILDEGSFVQTSVSKIAKRVKDVQASIAKGERDPDPWVTYFNQFFDIVEFANVFSQEKFANFNAEFGLTITETTVPNLNNTTYYQPTKNKTFNKVEALKILQSIDYSLLPDPDGSKKFIEDETNNEVNPFKNMEQYTKEMEFQLEVISQLKNTNTVLPLVAYFQKIGDKEIEVIKEIKEIKEITGITGIKKTVEVEKEVKVKVKLFTDKGIESLLTKNDRDTSDHAAIAYLGNFFRSYMESKLDINPKTILGFVTWLKDPYIDTFGGNTIYKSISEELANELAKSLTAQFGENILNIKNARFVEATLRLMTNAAALKATKMDEKYFKARYLSTTPYAIDFVEKEATISSDAGSIKLRTKAVLLNPTKLGGLMAKNIIAKQSKANIENTLLNIGIQEPTAADFFDIQTSFSNASKFRKNPQYVSKLLPFGLEVISLTTDQIGILNNIIANIANGGESHNNLDTAEGKSYITAFVDFMVKFGNALEADGKTLNSELIKKINKDDNGLFYYDIFNKQVLKKEGIDPNNYPVIANFNKDLTDQYQDSKGGSIEDKLRNSISVAASLSDLDKHMENRKETLKLLLSRFVENAGLRTEVDTTGTFLDIIKGIESALKASKPAVDKLKEKTLLLNIDEFYHLGANTKKTIYEFKTIIEDLGVKVNLIKIGATPEYFLYNKEGKDDQTITRIGEIKVLDGKIENNLDNTRTKILNKENLVVDVSSSNSIKEKYLAAKTSASLKNNIVIVDLDSTQEEITKYFKDNGEFLKDKVYLSATDIYGKKEGAEKEIAYFGSNLYAGGDTGSGPANAGNQIVIFKKGNISLRELKQSFGRNRSNAPLNAQVYCKNYKEVNT